MVTAALVLAWLWRLAPLRPNAGGDVAIADAIVTAANEDANPLVAAAILSALPLFESRFSSVAVSSPTDPVRSFGPWQTPAGLPELPASFPWCSPPSPVAMAREALRLARASLAHCGDLTEYASGHCGKAPHTAALRLRAARALLRHIPDPPAPPLPRRPSTLPPDAPWCPLSPQSTPVSS